MNNNIGIVRKIDPLGRLVIPKELRKILGIRNNELLEMSISNDSVVLQKHIPTVDIELFIRNFIYLNYGTDYQDYLVTKELCKSVENYIRESIEPNLLKEGENNEKH